MANFMEDLWTSIFTPGTTPTLLLATNATFAGLQIVLLGLLLMTYSIHFLMLSIITAGLWGSINWFAIETRKANEEAEWVRAKEERDGKKRETASPDESGTETEEVDISSKGSGARLTTGREQQGDVAKRRGSGDVEGSTDSEWDKLESEAEA
ncbi:MAG: SMK killer toxin resistance protein [Stictis urceolatum]|nr:SMK killer toxin resistance protein [Stictis urceolata]